jgi:glycosyltransferase involved in cell wall biosynthesis
MAKVSIIIPIYKVEKFVSLAVQSVLDQTFTDFELLLVDDGSPDNSRAICESFSDQRIKVISQVNRGLSGARNTGIRNAKSDILAFLDGDDLWVQNKLEKHLAHLHDSPDVGVSFSRSAFIDEEGKSLGTFQMPKLSHITASHLLFQNPVGNGSAPVVRREVLDSISFKVQINSSFEIWYFDENLRQSEDIDCWLRVATLTPWKIEGIPDALTLYRVNSGGLSADLCKQLYSWEQVISKARTYAPELIDKWASLSRAYQLRYLARQALRLKDGKTAVELINKAFSSDWRMILKEPKRTVLTTTAAYLLKYLPANSYSNFEEIVLKFMGRLQHKKIQIDRHSDQA